MCGIVGAYRADGHPLDRDVLVRMTDLQRHRGPDDQGFRLFSLRSEPHGSVEIERTAVAPPGYEGGVGFNRLSILDLSRNGHQPMTNDDASVFVVFNGEIYNAFDLRPELESAGFAFRSRTDTEVILRLYERHGVVGMLERLNGMFTICIVDLRRREMILCRDRLGIKPLYWCETGGAFLFASEVKSFLAYPGFRAELDEASLDEHLVYRFCAGEEFLLRGVRQLEPGTWMTVGPAGRAVRRYWDVPEGPVDAGASFRSSLDRLDDEVQRSVRMQLLSDVKVGCQLSGGVDSSIVNLFATKYGGADMDAFSIIFEDQRFSEERWIDRAASRARVHTHKFVLDDDYFLDRLPLATWHLDQPIVHHNSLGIFRLSEQARLHVKVLLSGEGADELFGGYYRFLFAALRPALRPWIPWLSWIPSFGPRVRRTFGGADGADDVSWFLGLSGAAYPERVQEIRPGARLDRATERRRAVFDAGRGSFVRNCLRYELKTYLVDLLVRQDKMTMAHSLENRVPLLDHEMVSFVRSLPTRFLVDDRPWVGWSRSRATKVLLKHLTARYFERDFVFRPKVGFVLPLKHTFAHPRFRSYVEDAILPSLKSRGILRADAVDRWWTLARGPAGDMDDMVWSCIAFETWAQIFLDGRIPSGPSPDVVGARA